MTKKRMGRPSQKLAEATQIVRGPKELIAAARAAAKREGVAISEWWRRAAYVRLNRDAPARSIEIAAGGRAVRKVQDRRGGWRVES